MLASPLASAQSLATPIEGAFTEVYVVAGRVVDALGKPAARAEVVIELDQRGVRSVPLHAATDCFGSFLTAFDLKEVRSDGEVKVTFKGQGGPDATVTRALDPFHRRSDLLVRYEGEWPGVGCPEQTRLWLNRVSVAGRLVNRTPTYEEGGASFDAKPYAGRVRAWFWPNANESICPPSAQVPGYCDTTAVQVDERGDFRYSWVFEQPFELTGEEKIEIVLDGSRHNFTLDPRFRIANVLLETSGQGAVTYDTPAVALPAALLALAAVAVALRRRRA